MTPQQLIKKIKTLPDRAPQTEALERMMRRSREKGSLAKTTVWCTSQKEHWLGWLSEYGGPGFYGRKVFDRDAAFAYNHCGCPPMALWLGEVAGVDAKIVKRAMIAAANESGTYSSKCAIIRRHITWAEIEPRLLAI